MVSTEFEVNWHFFIRSRQNAAWQSFENDVSRELEKAFYTPDLAKIRLTSTVIGTDGNDVSFVIDLHQMEVRLVDTGEAGIIRRDTATCIAHPSEIWEYEESDGNWKSYDLASCELLRIARGSGRTSTVVYPSGDWEMHSFEIDFILNQHVNRSTNKWHNIRLSTGCQLIPSFSEPAEELSQLDTEEVDVLPDDVELGNIVDGIQVNIQEEMRHMDGKSSIMEDESYLDDSLLVKMPNLLNRLELNSGDIKKVQDAPIGAGGYAKVYKVKYNGEIMVAKVFKMESSMEENAKDIYAMFSKEVCLLSQHQNKRIVKLHGFVATTVELALVLEYAQRGSLRSLLNNESEWNKLLPTQRHQILLDVAEGMFFLHMRKVAHRDLKSDNILITDDCRAKITDFGLSKSIEAISSTIKSSIKGTFQYIAPEGFDASTKDNFKGDVYSFGIFLWEVMSGILGRKKSIPWAEMEYPKVVCAVHVMRRRPELLAECISDENVLYSTVVVNVMNQCLNYEPTDRPSFDLVVKFLHCIKVISDSEIMEKIYELTGGALWKKNKGRGALWTRNKDRLSWQPNKCTLEFREADGRITYINLSNNNLIGMIPQEVGRLSYLTNLNLSYNTLKGKIPVELGKLLNLEVLYLSGNQLTGAVPKELGELSNLKELYLGNNQLTGAVPKELGELKNLEGLYLHSNQLTGAVPKELGQLSKLEKLYLHYNLLTGAIPKELGELSELNALYLDNNQLTGAVPKELGELKNLTHLHLYSNQLIGPIPAELAKLLQLVDLRLHSNQLTGAVPMELRELRNLVSLLLSKNQLTGAVPKELGELTNLTILFLHSNQLTGGPPIIPGCHIVFHPQRT